MKKIDGMSIDEIMSQISSKKRMCEIFSFMLKNKRSELTSKEIAKGIGKENTSIERFLYRLIDLQILVREKNKFKVYVYSLNFDQ